MDPCFWLSEGAKPGTQSLTDLVTVSAKDTAYHSVIVAQSGSGKSFFLGRLLEELALKTRGRLIVLDPNGDFRRFGDVVDEDHWRQAGYAPDLKRFRVPHEESRDKFEPRWKSMHPEVLFGPYLAAEGVIRHRVSWDSFPVAFLTEDLNAIARSQVYHCHEFVRSIAFLERERQQQDEAGKGRTKYDYPFHKAQKLLQRARHEGARQTLEEEFPTPFGAGIKVSQISSLTKWLGQLRQTRSRQARGRAISAVEFISPEIERYYFGRAEEYVAAEIVAKSTADESSGVQSAKIRVVDLPSFRDPWTQQIVLSSVVASAWDHARKQWAVAFGKDSESDERVPLYIVLEEAHNIVPHSAQGVSAKALLEQFRTIAAEGRKYGVFLILCTQRPDKIDPTIISECENRAVMRIGSENVLNKASELLGLESVPKEHLNKCLEFKTGRFLLAGPWAGKGVKLGYGAMRRTVEGGRSLREKHWAVPEPIEPREAAPPAS
ncbi:MAG TPA: ATP-binding protein [Candidatus Dormibacteraeota bacterium]|nr:ATP-binding protein [Candidatus Dormibacteraeota bacterium]